MSGRRSDGPSIPLVLGSRNRKKCREMAELISPPWEPDAWLSRLEIRSSMSSRRPTWSRMPAPSGAMRKKAAEQARALGRWVLADDSGLAVDALDGARRFLGAVCR